ncbi:uncharacterized protein VICG_00148 [Vittaforma corneae ATCC 50505]|uniref:Ribosomal RNA-processing protein 4 n=1 Tax=Vittaforma corneae (strain ATCC 50505) TaxID=993615 RepID=L2GPL5_VITCO|nr:uncharacterized protein VICG_00148 [Vittaforma corneae ATCC 50505]ELA42833.1 hypothetical protein VICG_00148 [Vittaforma corneae ATCC 50505]
MRKFFLPGDCVCENEGYIKGHGTEQIGDKIYSNYFGTVNQINKLITIAPVFSVRYTPEVGDVVVGRVIQIYSKKWKVDTNCRSDTTLSLGAINLPGVMQRRKSEEDEINMSKYFDINDVIVCEVQKVNKNGSAALHTRSDKYGRLSNGVLINVSPDLLVATKSRFIAKGGVEITSGCNGHIWISSKNDSSESFQQIAQIRSIIECAYDQNEAVDLEAIINKVVE